MSRMGGKDGTAKPEGAARPVLAVGAEVTYAGRVYVIAGIEDRSYRPKRSNHAQPGIVVYCKDA